MVRIHIRVAGDEQIEPAVAVVIAKARARRPAAVAGDAHLLGDVGERAIAVVAIQPVLAEVRDEEIDAAVVVEIARGDAEALTARDGESDKVLGLESGADDYLTKPFGIREMMARVGAIMRRSRRAGVERRLHREGAGARVDARDVALDADRRIALVRGDAVELTKQEFDLLYQLASRPGIVFSRSSLLQHVWSDDSYVTDRTVDAVISRLRRKIERDPHDPELILTAWGVGYKFVDA
jgi:DNA-binding response OmpR family regulator